MKKFFYLFALVSLVLLVFSVVNIIDKQVNSSYISAQLNTKGFEGITPDPEHDAVQKKLIGFSDKYQGIADQDQTWYFWLSFLVTGLTAGSTLVSSIQAAKTNPPAPVPGSLNKFAVTVAILTFLSTLANFGATQFNDKKTVALSKVTTITQDINDFNRKYDSAADAAAKATVVHDYNEKRY
jgi:hypothetical protein